MNIKKEMMNKENKDGGQCVPCVHGFTEHVCVCVRETLEIITIDFYPWNVEMLPDGFRTIVAQTYCVFIG